MLSSSSTSTYQTPFKPEHRRQSASHSADFQDANTAGRPFAFVPKRKSSGGNVDITATGNGEATARTSPSSQEGQVLFVEEPTLHEMVTRQQTPRVFFTFPSVKPEVMRGRIPRFDNEPKSEHPTSDASSTVSRFDLRDVCTIPDTSTTTSPLSLPVSLGFSPKFPIVLIRKKSGELVKPSLKTSGFATWSASTSARARTKSAPSTPIGTKSVHFDAQLEHVKLFLAEQKPLAVSRDGSPTETSEGDTTDTGYPFPSMILRIRPITSPASPSEPWLFDVCLEKISLEDTTLVGHVLVRNLAFAKWVAARFTLDSWQTTSEVAARHVTSLRNGTFDRFEFRIRLIDYLNGIELKRLVLCVRYSVEGREIWDSNEGKNYELGFERVKAKPIKKVTSERPTGHKVELTDPPLMMDLRSQLEMVVQNEQNNGRPLPLAMTSNRKKSRGLRVWLGDRLLGEDDDASPPPRPRPRSHSPVNHRRKAVAAHSLRDVGVPLSARYDFEASLKSPTWTPAQAHTALCSPLSKPKPTRHRTKSPPPAAFMPASISPRTGKYRRTMTIPLDTSPTPSPHACPRGSPRDSIDYSDEGVEEFRRLSFRDDDNWAVDDGRRRHHSRGWAGGSSYFDHAVSDTPSLKMTPPGAVVIIPPTPPRPGKTFHLGADESSSSSRSPSISPSASGGPLDDMWCALRPVDDESLSSTPLSQSNVEPLSPPEYFPRTPSDETLAGSTSLELGEAIRPPVDSTPYYSFLDQFCFFTGVNTYSTGSYNNIEEETLRRARSASNVDDYFVLSSSPNDNQQPPTEAPLSGSSITTRPPIPVDFMPSHKLGTPCPGAPEKFTQSALSTSVAG